MKYRVVEKFRDKYTNEIYEKDSEIDFSDARAEEVLTVGKYIELIEKPVKVAKNRKGGQKKQ